MNTPSPIPRVALIGVSGYGKIYVQLLRECHARGEVKLIAAVVINPQEEAAVVAELQSWGCTIYGSYEEMFVRERGRIELCMIPTGIHWHAAMTIAALRAGANVLVEKPLAASLADAQSIAQAEFESGRFVAVGFQDYYESATQWLKEQVSAGAIGALQSVSFLGIWPRPRSYYLRNDWAGHLKSNGMPVLDSPLNNAFAHFVMLSLYLAGAGRDVAAPPAKVESAELLRAHAIESFDTAVVRLTTAEGVKIWMGVSHCCRPQFDPEITLRGSRGVATWHYEREIRLQTNQGTTVRPMADITGARREMMAAVLARLRGENVRLCLPSLAQCHTQLIAQLHDEWPIEAVPADEIDWTENPKSSAAMPLIRGLEAAMHRAYTRQCSLNETGFSLAADSQNRTV